MPSCHFIQHGQIWRWKLIANANKESHKYVTTSSLKALCEPKSLALYYGFSTRVLKLFGKPTQINYFLSIVCTLFASNSSF